MTTQPAEKSPRWQRRKEERPAEILSAALRLFVERGFAATKLEDIARRAGITKGTMYLYFDSKEEIFKAAVRESMVPELARAEQLVDEHQGSARELLATLLHGWWSVVGEGRASGVPKLMMAEASTFPELARFYYEEVVRRGHRLIERALRLGIERGEFRDFDVRLGVRLALAPVLHAAIYKHSFMYCSPEPVDFKALIDQHIDTFVRGIAQEAPGEGQHA